MSELRCAACGEATFTLPEIFDDATPLACGACGARLCSWGEVRERVRAADAPAAPLPPADPDAGRRAAAPTRH